MKFSTYARTLWLCAYHARGRGTKHRLRIDGEASLELHPWDHAPRDRSEQQALGLVDIFVALTAALSALVGVGLVSIRTMSLARVLALDCAASGLVWAAMNRARAAKTAVT